MHSHSRSLAIRLECVAEHRFVHIVDDDFAVLTSAAFLVESMGYRVRRHASGESLLADPDLANAGCILLDVRMPGMSGLEVLTALQQRGIGAPVIVLTGHGDSASAREAREAGAFAFLEKPFDAMLLREALEQAM